jgi:hypothetical protein
VRRENFSCPVCGQHIFKTNFTDETCPVCYWINDIVQNEDPYYEGGANPKTLNQRRKEWQEQHKN